ncbi:amidase [Streptomyces sp. ACA25]|uniref:amidase n=1 Tax=Streptomyces sp. ACA25 TaxID=3022596 RepID=UPI002307C93E|nr:amidase [Streptomyces sp. ACA25]MDB1089587.1 amidase [Streptomyces sp. ACA25]
MTDFTTPTASSAPTGPDGLTDLTAGALTAGYAAGRFTPVDAARAALERAETVQPQVNAFVLLDGEAALEQAAASRDRWRSGRPAGPLDGVPVTVKDILLMRGHPTRRGSAGARTEGPFEEDAPSVARLRESGAVFLGKTTTPEFAWKGVTDCPPHGATGNPYDPSRTAGGSSGGSAAAVALGAGPLSLGTDGGGSVRIPASFCGIFALKPTYGRVPLYPASAFGTLAHVGPMTRDAADAALLLDVISRPDPRDWSHLGPPPGRFTDALADGAEGVRGLRVAYSPSLGFPGGSGQPVHPDVAAAVRRAVERLEELGAHVEEIDPPMLPVDTLREAFHTLWFSGAARVTEPYDARQRAAMDPGLQEICAQGARYSALDYLAAVDVRMALGKAMGAFHQNWDLLVTPSVPITAFGNGLEVPEGSGQHRWTEWAQLSYPFNMTQQPAASMPCGTDRDGLPIGLQLVSARHADALVLRAAHALYTAGVAELPAPPMLGGLTPAGN